MKRLKKDHFQKTNRDGVRSVNDEFQDLGSNPMQLSSPQSGPKARKQAFFTLKRPPWLLPIAGCNTHPIGTLANCLRWRFSQPASNGSLPDTSNFGHCVFPVYKIRAPLKETSSVLATPKQELSTQSTGTRCHAYTLEDSTGSKS